MPRRFRFSRQNVAGAIRTTVQRRDIPMLNFANYVDHTLTACVTSMTTFLDKRLALAQQTCRVSR